MRGADFRLGRLSSCGTFDRYATVEPDGDGGADGDLRGGGRRDSPARLPVAEERSEYRGSYIGELHDTSNDDDR